MPTPIDYGTVEALTFDCYGTLIDWEAGLTAAFRPILEAHQTSTDDEDVLVRFARHEATAEAGPYRTYREVLADGLRGVAGELAFTPTTEEVAAFSVSVRDWPAFADSGAALARLKGRFRLGVITNYDDDLFAASNRRLGVEFDWIVTAQQVGSYKPDEANFRARSSGWASRASGSCTSPRACSMTTCRPSTSGSRPWIDRRSDRPGSGATPPADASPDARYPDMASFAAAAVPG